LIFDYCRRAVYKVLKENDIDHPRFAILDRESGESKYISTCMQAFRRFGEGFYSAVKVRRNICGSYQSLPWGT
jgi:hypothetical protein